MRIPDDILEDAIRFRKRLTGEAELSESVGSSWNSAIIRRVCEACGKTETGDLEVHHIRERSSAVHNTNRLTDGSNVHSTANLVVLCDTCHDGIHNGSLHIGPLIQTSDGPERSIYDSVSSDRKSKWSGDEESVITDVCTKYKHLTNSALSKYLLNEHDIKISSATLHKFRRLG